VNKEVYLHHGQREGHLHALHCVAYQGQLLLCLLNALNVQTCMHHLKSDTMLLAQYAPQPQALPSSAGLHMRAMHSSKMQQSVTLQQKRHVQAAVKGLYLVEEPLRPRRESSCCLVSVPAGA
jgi:hypothetical protein